MGDKSGDTLQELLGCVEASARDLDAALHRMGEAIVQTQNLLREGMPLSRVLVASQCPAARAAVAWEAERLIDLLHDYRAETVRQLVDDEGWSITEVAELTGSARQVVSRLYHAGERAKPNRSRAKVDPSRRRVGQSRRSW